MKNGFVSINNNIFEVVLAVSEREQEVGLMNLDAPAPNMAFVYDHPRVSKFWMHNTKIPLDIVFCCNGKVTQICYGEPYSTTMIGDNKFSDLVVELPHGLVDKTGIKIGHPVDLITQS